jgi:hypothetical protein
MSDALSFAGGGYGHFSVAAGRPATLKVRVFRIELDERNDEPAHHRDDQAEDQDPTNRLRPWL